MHYLNPRVSLKLSYNYNKNNIVFKLYYKNNNMHREIVINLVVSYNFTR